MSKRFFAGKKYLFTMMLYFTDVLMFLFSASLAMLILKLDFTNAFYIRFFLFSLLILIINYASFRLYSSKRCLFDDNDFMKILYSVAITALVMIILVLMFNPGDGVLLGLICITLVLSIILTSISRFILFRVINIFRQAGYDRKRVLFFGENSEELISKIRENTSLGYDIVKITHDMNVLKSYLNRVDVVFLTKEEIDEKFLDLIVQNSKVNWKIIPSVLNLVIEPVAFDEFKDYPIINISSGDINSSYFILKRLMDLVLTGASLIILSPLFFVIAVIIKVTMPGPVFFKQERLGKNLKPFVLYKFRSMKVGADKEKAKLISKNEVKGLFKMKDDPRITKFGKFLRRTGIDELPQLINIFNGEMAIVGPRPHLQSELGNFKDWRRVRFTVKPGLTGMWQVYGRHELNFDKAVLYDVYYIRHMSLIMDMSIILKTVPALIINKGRF
jgi:exopolysaccharide biosynthesis polyprenyl glycosylphosphotransferase